MKVQDIYKNYEELSKPYQGNVSVTPEGLHLEVMRHIDSIGNSNPHWNRLNEIEIVLRDWYQF